ncbi:TaqI-like C-terminal specificity domain-containing protein [Mesonia sp. MT50]|uniref:site-specific DNA-methyltransferase (adenine-specific) n=1 Tax=Mesonia profundi TaxID=3070998 RepID=A0ABU1A0S3_9FLAO|nr:N-6 DNA methylase [Mesonia profundi]MDQ7917204.1 TaqI-like C-terminal specificity domain-containing protein [Mesonia profundi]
MSLFQDTVVKKYLQALDQATIEAKWEQFNAYFKNPEIQTNIRNSKEEQFQEGFLRELFVKVLGYTLNPNPDFNLNTEYKNVKDSKKADGAILVNNQVKGVIELKGTETTDLSKVEVQAFGYKNNQPECVYVITSNFEKIRFYIDNAIEHIEFNLFTLTKEQFKVLYLVLAYENISKDIPKKIKDESISQEDKITKELYKDYSLFKKELHHSLVALNPNYDALVLFKKSQKLLDRFLFLFFAEDRMLLPPNSVRLVLSDWKDLIDRDVDIPLYTRFKKYFGYLNTGYKGKRYDVFAYNGGLFKPDEVLDTIEIDDDLLYRHTKQLSEYDFQSEVDVNILGHIFENSLNELEEIQAELEGQEIDKSKSKRKKDGVFYTPKYITKYIVDNTVGKLCEVKRLELDITDEAYQPAIKRSRKRLENLQNYRDWLLQLTICDPACGSGAFLNEALNHLIAEHRYIDELSAKYNRDALMLSDVENSILENNLFGVDLNQESVEIAKLSLWLRTAQPNRKLNDLSNNIKCGNSLIDDPEVGGVKAFNWQEEFPHIFEKGGFDVIIGNPPYVRKQGLMEHYPEMCEFYENKYQSATANYDIYALFMERSFDLINEKGIVSYILPHKFLVTDFGVGIRQFFVEKCAVESILHFGSDMVFSDASTYTCIINLDKTQKNKVLFKKIKPIEINDPFKWDYVLYENLCEDNWDLQSQEIFDTINKLKQQPYTVDNVFVRIFQGIASGGDKLFTIELIENNGNTGLFFSDILDEEIEIEFDILKPFIKGNQISKYQNIANTLFTIFPYKINKNKTIPLKFNDIESEFPLAAKYFRKNEKFLRGREKRRFDNEDEWFLFSRKQGISGVEIPKIMTQEISLGCNMSYDEKGEFYHPTTIYSFVKNDDFVVDEKFYLGILNSKVMWFFLKNTGTELSGGYFRFKTNYLKPFPLPEIPNNPNLIIDSTNQMLSFNKDLQNVSTKFIRTLQRKFPEQLEKTSKKLDNWYELDFTEFIKELKKKKIKLSLGEEADWEDYFLAEQQKAQALLNKINHTDKAIDQMVYELYDLNEEEIAIVENS